MTLVTKLKLKISNTNYLINHPKENLKRKFYLQYKKAQYLK